MPLEIVDFTSAPQGYAGANIELAVGLNRNDVNVTYQWQMMRPPVEEDAELLHDYTDEADTSYYFPYFDITEAELLAMNPDATWPGIEMYLAALEAAGGDASVVDMENGTPNTFVEGENTPEDAPAGLEEPVWEDIEGATAGTYTFALDAENATYT